MAATRRLEELRGQLDARTVTPAGPNLVALSGGADSAALAAIVADRSPTRALHVHHGLPASDQMEGAARSIAANLNLRLIVERTTIVPFSEVAARNERYRLLERALAEKEWLLTGHTLDDQAETVLGNLMRGAGSGGLRGIPARRGRIVRPFLQVSRSEAREFATLAGLPWLDDPQNEDLSYLRNRIRHWLIPTLEAEFNPRIRAALVAAADAFSALEVEEPIGEYADDVWRVANSILWVAGSKRAAAILRSSLRPLFDGYGPDRAEVERVWKVVSGDTTAAELKGGLRVYRDGPWLICARSGGGGTAVSSR
ncbi:MAG TPA: tRNA lysidine(34) synthetase TilS [Acidimicrobiia bacterium]